MPAEHDLDPSAMTDEERRAKRRFEAGFAFETCPLGPPCKIDGRVAYAWCSECQRVRKSTLDCPLGGDTHGDEQIPVDGLPLVH